jgi:hypothetical protein
MDGLELGFRVDDEDIDGLIAEPHLQQSSEPQALLAGVRLMAPELDEKVDIPATLAVIDARAEQAHPRLLAENLARGVSDDFSGFWGQAHASCPVSNSGADRRLFSGVLPCRGKDSRKMQQRSLFLFD